MTVSTTTRGARRHLVGLIGSGIGASLSPALHEREAGALGLRYDYRRLDIEDLGLDARDAGTLLRAAQRTGFAGVNITHPCKQEIVGELDELSTVARSLGAVNTVVFSGGRRLGHNTDVSGFRRGFVEGLDGAPLERVVLLGAGGAGAAVAHALMTLGARRLSVIDVDAGRAGELCAALGRRFGAGRARPAAVEEAGALLWDADGLAHATPTGMATHPGLPVPAEWLGEHLWVAEVVYRPLETDLLRAARDAGCRTLDGGRMAVFQAADSLELFTGARADRGRMLRHFARLVAADDVRAEVALR